MRDWRNDQVHTIDARTIDIMTAAHRLLETDEPYMLLSATAARKPTPCCAAGPRVWPAIRSTMQGEAADLRINSRSVSQIFNAARALQRRRRRALTFRARISCTWIAARSGPGAA